MKIYSKKMLFLFFGMLIVLVGIFVSLNIHHDNLDKNRVVALPIIMYHHFDTDESKQNDLIMTPKTFLEQMSFLYHNNYTPIFYEDLDKFVNGRGTMPKNPVIITFDDGYQSNFDLAYKILESLKFKCEISVVGATVGKTEKEIPGIIPHFNWDEAKVYYGLGLLRFESHTYDMHKASDGISVRDGVLQMQEESDEDYKKALTDDFSLSRSQIIDHLARAPVAMTYPYGKNSTISEEVADSLGFKITVTTDVGINIIKKGVPLKKLKRYNISSSMSGEDLVKMLNEEKKLRFGKIYF